MITKDMTRDLIGRQAVDSHGEKVGKIGQVYLDEQNGTPTWATVNTGLFGTKESFVPLQNADLKDSAVELPVEKQQVKDCPHVGRSDERLTGSEEDELYRHYGTAAGATGVTGGAGDGRHAATDTAEAGRERSGGTSGDDAMVRHEERLRVGTEAEETGRVALRKYVVTEDQTVTVPVSHEEVRLEREPITDDGTAGSARPGVIGEEEQEITLHRERPVVDKTTEAVEKVRLGTRTVTEEEQVSGTVRKEQIDVDDPSDSLER
ncbi:MULTISPECIES: DUF2382 domain-containing protein [Pseudonocardia]|uniref:Stress response protein YsnF n=2 Tax=Pseudonocardia TaxID=1847 RepID=A0A1Y2N0H3_PSEAH|nr:MULTISPECIES: PRC and DUF2382 domain-containing protein [Pseudonocardia]OSY40597.1 Stress response protein YsnF [Pseudonocardia autotrophica]TDN73606.1 uncharacterized protein (TIGR02271 family) [Pseudonocardia autotrophica]BBG04350.1 hypothetical protein Pdca_55590 [Pseudonocardia autotrophica]GEC25216.1 hypothetical protein PSA01_22450 [Pseudonocardia saturnea]